MESFKIPNTSALQKSETEKENRIATTPSHEKVKEKSLGNLRNGKKIKKEKEKKLRNFFFYF